jgi:signal peptidase I
MLLMTSLKATTMTRPRTPRGTGDRARPNVSSGRESIESFVMVFLVFLVLGVEAEGFVIPTGSMAPTLMGRHKEVTCPQCGLVYAVDGNREIEPTGTGLHPGPVPVEMAVCVNCRFPARVLDEPNFQGDRIYVMKTPLNVPFLPALGSVALGRWDIAVFKLPEEPEVRYIKRMVGMPNEVVRILRGDIWTRPQTGDAPFQRAFRSLRHQDAMQIVVNDDAHRPRALADDPRWARWAPRVAGTWDESTTETGVYRTSGAGSDWSELRYRHVVPDPVQWAAIAQGKALPHPPRATLITDFYAYNTDITAEARTHPWAASKAWRQPHWVGDLALKFMLDVKERKGLARVELVKAGVASRCEFDLETGLVSLWRGDRQVGPPTPAGITRPGTYAVSFANVDDRLTLRVDDRLPFGEGIRVDPDGAFAPTAADLDPVGIAARGASVAVRGLVLSRDIYYTLRPARLDYDDLDLDERFPTDPVAMFDWLADPRKFPPLAKLGPRDFPIAPGRYMMLGDNSPWSRDGREWERTDQQATRGRGGWDDSGRESWEVPESLLVGKAFCVYWPHLKPFGPTIRLGRDLRLPARPYFEAMRWVR